MLMHLILLWISKAGIQKCSSFVIVIFAFRIILVLPKNTTKKPVAYPILFTVIVNVALMQGKSLGGWWLVKLWDFHSE